MFLVEQDYQYLGQDRWEWSARIAGEASDLDKIEKVTWYLHHTFSDSVVDNKQRSTRFEIVRQGWGVFQLAACLTLRGGEEVNLTHWLELEYPEEPSTDAPSKDAYREPSRSSAKSKVFLSYGAEDRALAENVKQKLERGGYEVLEPAAVEAGVPLDAAVGKMVRDSDVVMGLFTSEFASPTVVTELNKAGRAHKPVLAIGKPGIGQPYGLKQSLNHVDIDFSSESAGDQLVAMVGEFQQHEF